MTDIAGERARLAAQGLDIVTRESWGSGVNYSADRTVTRPAQWLFLHVAVIVDPDDLAGHEDDSMRTIEKIGLQRFGQDKAGNWIGFPYNAAAFDTGRLYEGQPLSRRGAHTVNDLPNAAFPAGSLNHLARALVLPQMVTDDVTDAQMDSAARWGAALCRSGEAIPGAVWHGHREVTAKDCPGDKAFARIPELNALTRYYETHGLEDDMPNTKEEIVAWTREAVQAEMTTIGDPTRVAIYDLTKRAVVEASPDIAAEVARLISENPRVLSDADLAAIAVAVNDEQHRRSEA